MTSVGETNQAIVRVTEEGAYVAIPLEGEIFCPYCKVMRFKWIDNFEAHVKSVHSTRLTITCNRCARVESSANQMAEHYKKCISDDNKNLSSFECVECLRVFKTKHDFSQHKRRKHGAGIKRSRYKTKKIKNVMKMKVQEICDQMQASDDISHNLFLTAQKNVLSPAQNMCSMKNFNMDTSFQGRVASDNTVSSGCSLDKSLKNADTEGNEINMEENQDCSTIDVDEKDEECSSRFSDSSTSTVRPFLKGKGDSESSSDIEGGADDLESFRSLCRTQIKINGHLVKSLNRMNELLEEIVILKKKELKMEKYHFINKGYLLPD